MTTLTGCPEPMLLSQLLDRELAAEEERTLRRHVDTCTTCRARIDRLTQAKETAQAELSRAFSRFSSTTPLPACLSPERVSAYVQRLLPVDEYAAAERHLRTCHECLGEVMEAFRITNALTATGNIPVPEALKARVASRWRQAPVATASKAATLSRLVIQIAQTGLQLVEQHLIAPLLDVQEIRVPMPAYRAGEASAPLAFTMKTEHASIETIVLREGAGVALKLTLHDAEQKPLVGQRVFLRLQGRPIFSAKSDHEGAIRSPHVEPGEYEVSCPGMDLSFQVELQL